MITITSIFARWILDSRGLPTVFCEVTLDQNGKKATGKASVPSGASTGTYEALELRDNDKNFFHGKGVTKSVNNVNQIIAGHLINREFATAMDVDEAVLNLDKSENKTQLGANSILAVSMAMYRAYADLFGLELWQYLRRLYFSSLPVVAKFPKLMCNIINGGVHADSGLAIQEFMIVPNSGEIETDVRAASEIYHTLKKNLQSDDQIVSLGDEGGFAPKIPTTKEALDYIIKAITDSGYNNLNCQLALDAAASEFFNKEAQTYSVDKKEFSQSNLTDFYAELKDLYPNLVSIEDGFAEDDILGWEIVTQKIGQKIHLIGDDLFVTNPKRFEEIGLKNQIANGVLIKLNQIGSVIETAQMINKAKENNYITIVSHRSGETTDDFISDLAFASQSEFIKLGAPARGERVAKYNRLLDIKASL